MSRNFWEIFENYYITISVLSRNWTNASKKQFLRNWSVFDSLVFNGFSKNFGKVQLIKIFNII